MSFALFTRNLPMCLHDLSYQVFGDALIINIEGDVDGRRDDLIEGLIEVRSYVGR